MDINKAPGPNNVPIEFYQHCWDVVRFDIMRLFVNFYHESLAVQRLNDGVITLLPKMVDANKDSTISAHLYFEEYLLVDYKNFDSSARTLCS